MPRSIMRRASLLAIAALALALSASPAAAQQAGDQRPITLKVEAPTGGESFACRIPVSVSHAESLELESLNVVAKAYQGNRELASTGIDTAGRPLVEDRDPNRVEYNAAPLQFDLGEEDCEKVTGLGVVFASCTFANGEAEDCLDRIRFKPESAGEVAFFVGEPKPPAR